MFFQFQLNQNIFLKGVYKIRQAMDQLHDLSSFPNQVVKMKSLSRRQRQLRHGVCNRYCESPNLYSLHSILGVVDLAHGQTPPLTNLLSVQNIRFPNALLWHCEYSTQYAIIMSPPHTLGVDCNRDHSYFVRGILPGGKHEHLFLYHINVKA